MITITMIHWLHWRSDGEPVKDLEGVSCTVGARLQLMVILVSAEVLCNSHMLCTEFPNHERWGVFKFHTPRLSCWGFYLKPHPQQFKVIDFYRSCHNKILKNIQQLCMWILLWRLSLKSHFYACNSMKFHLSCLVYYIVFYTLRSPT